MKEIILDWQELLLILEIYYINMILYVIYKTNFHVIYKTIHCISIFSKEVLLLLCLISCHVKFVSGYW